MNKTDVFTASTIRSNVGCLDIGNALRVRTAVMLQGARHDSIRAAAH